MILRTSSCTPWPSVDHYVRLTGSDLQDLCMDLQWTEWPATTDGQSLGYTEWAGQWGGALVSVACFWRSYSDGPEPPSDPLDVSTNLMLVDAKGFDAGTRGTAVALVRLIHERLLSELAGQGARRPPPAASGGLLQ